MWVLLTVVERVGVGNRLYLYQLRRMLYWVDRGLKAGECLKILDLSKLRPNSGSQQKIGNFTVISWREKNDDACYLNQWPFRIALFPGERIMRPCAKIG